METERLIEIVVMARQGNENAMQTLYLDAYRSVYYLALRMVKNPEDAEDITQEVFITVQEKISELREPAAFYKWVNQITVNKCNYLLRKYKGIARLDDGDEILALVDDNPMNLPDKAIDDAATRQIILDVIDALPDGQRVCVMLYYYQQNTISQIADMLETNENTVKTRLSLARAKIRAALEEKEKKEGIKLYGIPLALTPILRQAAQDFVMPEGVAERIWENISKAKAGGAPSNGGPGADQPGGPGTSGQNVPKSGTGSAVTGAAVKGMTLVTKIIIGVIAAAVVAAGGFIISRLINTTDEPELLETIEIDFVKDVPYNVDLDGDGIEDTIDVKRGNSVDTLVISSSRYGEYNAMFEGTYVPDNVKLLAIDTGNHDYSLCVYMPTGSIGGASSIDGLILYGTSEGWEKITSLLPVSYMFSGEVQDDQMFTVEGETGFSSQFTTSNTNFERGMKISSDNRISFASYVLNEETGGYDFVLEQYLYSEFLDNGIGFGYTQVSIDTDAKTLIPVKQWVEPF